MNEEEKKSAIWCLELKQGVEKMKKTNKQIPKEKIMNMKKRYINNSL